MSWMYCLIIFKAPSLNGQWCSLLSLKTGSLKKRCLVWPFMLKAAIPVGAKTATVQDCLEGSE